MGTPTPEDNIVYASDYVDFGDDGMGDEYENPFEPDDFDDNDYGNIEDTELDVDEPTEDIPDYPDDGMDGFE